MDILGIPIDDWWEQAIAVYFAGYIPAWFATYRGCTEWQLMGESVVRKYKASDGPATVFWCGIFWPIVACAFGIVNTMDSFGGSRLLNGKPPKKLLAEALDKKADRLMKDEPEPKPQSKEKSPFKEFDTDY